MHAYGRYAYGRYAYGRYAYGMAVYERHAYGDGLLEMHVYKSYHSRKRLLEKPASLTVFLPAVASDKEDP
jgi:hypothetical protein